MTKPTAPPPSAATKPADRAMSPWPGWVQCRAEVCDRQHRQHAGRPWHDTAPEPFVPRSVADQLARWQPMPGKRRPARFAGLVLAAIGEEGDESLITAGHVDPALMIRACVEYQRWFDGDGDPLWVRARRRARSVAVTWRSTRKLGDGLARTARRTVKLVLLDRQIARHAAADRPGPDQVEHVWARLIPGCPQDGDLASEGYEPEEIAEIRADHPVGCNCEGPYVTWTRHGVGEPATVVEWPL